MDEQEQQRQDAHWANQRCILAQGAPVARANNSLPDSGFSARPCSSTHKHASQFPTRRQCEYTHGWSILRFAAASQRVQRGLLPASTSFRPSVASSQPPHTQLATPALYLPRITRTPFISELLTSIYNTIAPQSTPRSLGLRPHRAVADVWRPTVTVR